ncbi:Uncharacterised protein [Mycobacteroides abscessus subsp. abscessus]|nr:Uncharacterised protein [Mycobacteroides abscessus]SHV71636.1 Uncharacterised protein [Mycobacteroides abscessus subsp. abscessus]
MRQGHFRIQISQQAVGQWVREAAQLLLHRLHDEAQRGVATADLRPRKVTHRQRRRIFGGEPSHRPRQINIGGQLFGAAMAFEVDADGSTARTQEFVPGQCKGDEQNVLHPSMERGRYLTEQHPCDVGVQSHRQRARDGIGVYAGPNHRQRGRYRRHRPPDIRRLHHTRA